MTNFENNELQTLLDLDALVFWPNAKLLGEVQCKDGHTDG